MATGFALLDNHNAVKQYRETRRNGGKPSGVVVIHTAENVTDFAGPDGSAESVLRFILSRTNFGSYHVLCDFDTTIQCAPWSYECWHDTTSNNHSVGISAAVASADWAKLGKRGDAIVIRMALKAREYAAWVKKNYGIVIPARLITRNQAIARVPGFVAHGTMDPNRRTDPGSKFNWGLFLDVFRDGNIDTPENVDETKPHVPTEEEIMTSIAAELINSVRAIVEQEVSQRVPRLPIFKLAGTHAAYQEIAGQYRRHVTAELNEDGKYDIIELPVSADFWKLPLLGYVPEIYSLEGSETVEQESAYAFLEGQLVYISKEQWDALREKNRNARLIELPATHDLWTLLPKV